MKRILLLSIVVLALLAGCIGPGPEPPPDNFTCWDESVVTDLALCPMEGECTVDEDCTQEWAGENCTRTCPTPYCNEGVCGCTGDELCTGEEDDNGLVDIVDHPVDKPPGLSYEEEYLQNAKDFGQDVQRGDLTVTLVRAGPYRHLEYGTQGDETISYRIDIEVTSNVTEETEYLILFGVTDDLDNSYTLSHLSTLELMGMISPGETISGTLVFMDMDPDASTFNIRVSTRSPLTYYPVDVVGENLLSNKAVGIVNYGDVCSSLDSEAAKKAIAFLGDLYDEQATREKCTSISGARDYGYLFTESKVYYSIKLKNHMEEPVRLFVVEDVPKEFSASASSMDFKPAVEVLEEDPVIGWPVKISRNQIWKGRMNITTYVDENQVASLDMPTVLVLK